MTGARKLDALDFYEEMPRERGYEIREENDLTLSHSAMIRFGLPE